MMKNRMKGMTDNELKAVQKAIKTFNLYYASAARTTELLDNTQGIMDELIDVNRMSKKGYAKYSMKMLKSMTRQEIEEYMGDIQNAKHLLVAVNKLPDFVEYASEIALKGDREALWSVWDKMQDLGYKLWSSSEFQDIVDTEEVSLSSIVEKLIEVTTTDLGASGFAEWFKNVKSL